ncbi:oligosaccharide flippase family protein [Heliobacillus mobilis]|uniref:Oligosaccharide flippase family protein n=1 Tax=Heliobacterium mobile TaxID=28064 RepID=A0A6I3SHW4_HELMO|nr:polysaccharide biosynthesis protein [Heliobacterium mobile]MTV48469.1 oligosaccharide flippase family protein [Heliobacterium mobile]
MAWQGTGGRRFLMGALWLTGAGIVSKFLGAFYRIPLARILGSEGVGLYQMVYPIYTVALSLATAGLPVAISVLVAQRAIHGDHRGAYRVFLASFGLLFGLGCGATYLMVHYAPFLARGVLQDERTMFSLWAIAPAVLLTALMAAFRGYFQGYQHMIPTALSQVAEQLVRVGTILWLSLYLLGYGVDVAAAGATFGAVTGGIAGLVVLGGFFYYWQRQTHGGIPRKNLFDDESAAAEAAPPVVHSKSIFGLWKDLLILSLPISLGGLVTPIMQTVDAVLIPRGLQLAGYTASQAASLFGEFSGMAASLVGLPSIVTGAVGASLVPVISALWNRGDRPLAMERYLSSVRIVALLSWPAAAGLVALAEPIGALLFHAPGSALPMVWLAPTILSSALYQVVTSGLQGMGRTAFPVVALIIGTVLKVGSNIVLMPRWGLLGAAVGSNVGFLVAAILVLWYIRIQSGVSFPWSAALLKPFVAATMMAGYALVGVPYLTNMVGPWSGLALSMITSSIIYGLTLLAIGGIQAVDLAMIPRVGPRLASWHRQFWGA